MTFNPCPKPYRVKLGRGTVAWRNLVDDVYARESGYCQGCGHWLPRENAAPHHIKTYGAGGGDVIGNLALLGKPCHIKIDSGELKNCDLNRENMRVKETI